ncbi:MAG: hypothetical protein GF355_03945, partial [Candidatus Eisenbacteria bacterium]|nr:hypothetical protein [Candidatus Eisenbacteria bacterium]
TLAQDLGRFPTESEVAAHLKIPIRRVRRLQNLREGVLSLDATPPGDENARTLQERVPSKLDLESVVEGHLQKAELDGWLRALPAKEELVLRSRYGFLDGQRHSLAEISLQLGRSREGIRQMELRALRTLRGWVLAPDRGLGKHELEAVLSGPV